MSAADLLGGAEGRRARPRGFAPWNPQRDTLAVITQVRAVLVEYAQYLPLTIRQVFYRLVGAHDFPKTEQSYGQLVDYLNRGRRARLIPMDVIRDDGGARYVGKGWRSAEAFLRDLGAQAATFTLDRTIGQPLELMVLCEAAGMAPQLARVTGQFDIPVLSSGGFDSVTELYRLAADIAQAGRPAEILHIGDHDPSGAHLYVSMVENIGAFVGDLGGKVSFSRLAVTPQQITDFDLPTAPPKASDHRAFSGDTCQAEALAPDVLARILREAIEARLDRAAFERVLRQEARERDRLVALIAGLAG